MTWVDLLWFPPLMLAIAVVVGAAGRDRGEMQGAVKRAFFGLSVAVVLVALIVRVVVEVFT